MATKRQLEHYQALADAAQIQARHNSAAASRAAQDRLQAHGIEPSPVFGHFHELPVITVKTIFADYVGVVIVCAVVFAIAVALLAAKGKL